MFKIQSTHVSVLHRAIFVVIGCVVVWNFTVLNIAYAGEQSFIYVSDIIQGQRNTNSEQEIWQYQHEIPLNFQDNDNYYQTQYTYLPPTQKIGSNPFLNPRNKYQYALNNDADSHTNNVAGNTYKYLPPIQKIGSNPFIKPNNQYVNPHNIAEVLASSCACENSDYRRVFANY